MHHDELYGRGDTPHHVIDNALFPALSQTPQGEWAIDDLLSLESSLNAPGSGTAPSRTTYNNYFSLWSMPNAAARYLASTVQLPHGYIPDSPLMWHVHFVPDTKNIAAGETVIFRAHITYGSLNEVMTDVPGTYVETVYTAPSTITAGSATTPGTHCMTASVEIDPTSLGGSGFILSHIYRAPVQDTYGGAVWVLGSDCHIRKNRVGSATENPSI